MTQFSYYTIPSRTFPESLTELGQGIYCFKSNAKSDINALYKNCVGLLIDTSINQNYFEVLCNYIVSVNLFRQEHIAIQWLANLNKEDYLININKNDVKNFILNNSSEDKNFVYVEDYNEIVIHLVSKNDLKYSFIEVFQKFSKLEKNSFLDNTLRYLAINFCLISTTQILYDNALFQNSTLFQIFETILNEFEPITPEQRDYCVKCERQITPGLKKRITNFLENRDLNHKDISSAILKVAETRHKFFHNLKGKSSTDYINAIIANQDDNFISYEKELNEADAILLGVGLLKTVITSILIDELIKTET